MLYRYRHGVCGKRSNSCDDYAPAVDDVALTGEGCTEAGILLTARPACVTYGARSWHEEERDGAQSGSDGE
jgi:hypothetical protein